MAYKDLSSFLSSPAFAKTPKGPMAIIFGEDDIGVISCIRHHVGQGFVSVLMIGRPDLELPSDCTEVCHVISEEFGGEASVPHAINKVIDANEGRWLFYCYNSEFFHFPFCESRSVAELAEFTQEERRSAVFSTVVDLYSDNLEKDKEGYSLESAHLDSAGYYASTRYYGPDEADRELDIFGGLKWRFEEHLPFERRRIDRISLFRAAKGLRIDRNNLFNLPEYNTYASPWHHSVTTTLASFRTAKYLKTNPGSAFDIHNFMWSKSTKFHWNSQQLMDLGFMEPGQWF